MGRAAQEKTAAAKHKAKTAAPRMTSPTAAGTTPERPATTSGQGAVQEGDFEAPLGKVSGKNVRAYCNNSVCRHLKEWFIETHSAVVHGSRESAHSNSYSYGPIRADGDDLMQSCVEYSKRPEAGMQDVLSFLSHFNLDIRHMADDPAEDPLKRMMELSLDYGVDAPVAFTRHYDVTGDASAPFVIDIALNPEMNEFISASRTMGEEDIEVFYRSFLKQYALVENNTIKEQLMDSDD
ncbi:hypothetical protein HPB50_008750 [Hyalomma asiaticum]|uniref:Uncharacterized protein n=1 Tax=Hyalomma asiaticum TaxID=266040 RepID=A0ACB7T6M3_HYAAI|nr:hypothetical protein HPB50_008750 [Hyalomma asiaticum]